jgi:hypothetical protein
MNIEDEEFSLKYKNLEDLSYKELGKYYVDLYHKNKRICAIEVWKDNEQEDREYIIINYEIIYLDTIKEL